MEALAEAELIKIVEKITMTGDPKLDDKMLKVIKKACK